MVKNQISCEICLKAFGTKKKKTLHLKEHMENEKWICFECQKMHSTKAKLIEHINRHKGTPPFKCEKCRKQFFRKDRLKTHTLAHLGQRDFECPMCLMRFRRKYELNKHKRTHDEDLKEKMKKYVCEECGKKSYSRAENNRHMLKHSGKRNFACTVCKKKFKEKYTLTSHQVCKHFYKD